VYPAPYFLRRARKLKFLLLELLRVFVIAFENTRVEAPQLVLVQFLDCVIPAWSAAIQADMDVSYGRLGLS